MPIDKSWQYNDRAELIVVLQDLDVISTREMIEHEELLDRYGARPMGWKTRESLLRARYWFDTNQLMLTLVDQKDIEPGGRLEEQFNALYTYLSDKYPRFGPTTPTMFVYGQGVTTPVAALVAPRRRYPRRRSVFVQGHRRSG